MADTFVSKSSEYSISIILPFFSRGSANEILACETVGLAGGEVIIGVVVVMGAVVTFGAVVTIGAVVTVGAVVNDVVEDVPEFLFQKLMWS